MMTGKITENHKAIRKIVLFAMITATVLIAAFYAIERIHIRNSAVQSINKAVERGESVDSALPAAYYIYTDEINAGVLIDSEEKLAEYYLKQNRISDDVSVFKNDGYHIYYTSRSSEYGDMIIYSDVTFSVHMVNRTAAILFVMMVICCLLMLYISNRLALQLDRKDESMKQFFANASHELKTPLMAIRGNVDGIRNGYVPAEKACCVIEKETNRMNHLISDILELSKVDSGAVLPKLKRIDLREIIYDSCNMIMPSAQEKGIALNIAIDKPVFLECDEAMLFSAFSNILTNGIRYAESEISVTAGMEKGSCHIVFSNDGDVITDEDMAHIFDRFYTGSKGQTGIGMNLAREYIHLHHGEMAVGRSNGKTVFEIDLKI